MQKSIRTLALTLTLALSLTAVPMLHAERTGTNPPPQFDSLSNFALILDVALGFYGL